MVAYNKCKKNKQNKRNHHWRTQKRKTEHELYFHARLLGRDDFSGPVQLHAVE
jgi:hypothetical protein